MTQEEAWEARVREQEEQVGKAFVSICVYPPSQAEVPKFAPFSGFVFCVEDQWFLVTAEHVFTGHDEHLGLDRLLELHPETRIELQPFLGGIRTATRLVVDPRRRLSTTQLAEAWKDTLEEQEYDGLMNADIISMPLLDYYKRNLAAVGVQPLLWDQVRFVPDAEAAELIRDSHVTAKLFGIPATGVEIKEGSASAWLLRLPVEPAGQDPPFTYWFPTWNTSEVPDDVCGTSGGPIVLLGADRPLLVGVQIAQQRICGRRRLKAVNAFPFFELLRSLVPQ